MIDTTPPSARSQRPCSRVSLKGGREHQPAADERPSCCDDHKGEQCSAGEQSGDHAHYDVESALCQEQAPALIGWLSAHGCHDAEHAIGQQIGCEQ